VLHVGFAGAPRRSRAQELFVQLALCTALDGDAARRRTARDGPLPGEELLGRAEDS